MISASRVTVAATAVALNTASTSGQRLVITNTESTATTAIDLGDADVAATEGFPLAGGDTVTVELAPGDVLYAIRSTSTSAAVAVLIT